MSCCNTPHVVKCAVPTHHSSGQLHALYQAMPGKILPRSFLRQSCRVSRPAIQRAEQRGKIHRRLLGQGRGFHFAAIEKSGQVRRDIAQPDMAFAFRHESAATIDFIHP